MSTVLEETSVSVPVDPNPNKYRVEQIPIDEIHLDEQFNCRGQIAPIDVMELSQDIKERGLDTPITIQPYSEIPGKKWRIVAGHRRFTAFEVNRMDPDKAVSERHSKIPCFIATDLDEVKARTMNLRENLHRKQLNIMQEANAIKYYLACKFYEQDIADMVGTSRGWVQVRKALLSLPKQIQEVAAAGLLTQAQIKYCANLRTEAKQFDFVKMVKLRKEKQEKIDITPTIKRSQDALKLHERKASEIREMKELIYDTFGPCLATRFGAWAEGIISTVELNNDIAREAKEKGRTYKTPDWINRALVGDRSIHE